MSGTRLFLAVIPPDDIIGKIRDLPSQSQRGVRWTKPEQWHITLKFLGVANPYEAIPALTQVDGQKTTARIGPAVTLLGQRVMILPVTGVEALAAAIAEPFAEIGEPQEPREFAGHLTLARLKGAPLKDPSSVSLLDHEFSAEFPVETIALVESQLSSDGATYEVLAELELS